MSVPSVTVLDTFAFEAHSPDMSKPAVILAAIVASISFAGVAHANGDSEPTCGYDQECETTTSVATDEPPVPTTTVAPTSTIGAINGPATVNLPETTVAPTTTITTIVFDDGVIALPATGSGSQTVALVGLVLVALGALLLGVRWAFKR